MRVVLIAMLVLLGSAPAFAECVTTERILNDHKDFRLVARLDASNSEPFMAATREASKQILDANEVLIFDEGDKWHVLLLKNGCFAKQGKFPPAMVDQWLHGVTG